MSKKWFEWFMIATACFALGASMCSCTTDDEDLNPCITGDCNVSLKIDKLSQPDSYKDANGYWHIYHTGSQYFTVNATYSSLKGSYVRGTLPLIETAWDTDYWYRIAGEVVMISNLYNPLGSDYTYGFTVVYPSETREVAIDVSTINELHNLSGRYMRDNVKGPLPETSSTVKYTSSKSFVYLPEMKKDTVTIDAFTSFAWDSPLRVNLENQIKVILE